MLTHRPLPALVIAALILSPLFSLGAPASADTAAFDRYTQSVESQLSARHRSAASFVVLPMPGSPTDAQLHRGDPVIERLAMQEFSAALLHHWRATAFVPGATAAGLDAILRDQNSYPRLFSPQVLRVRSTALTRDHYQVTMRVRQRHVITVVLDTAYNVTFDRLDPQHRFSLSRSTGVSEIDSPGTPSEHALSPQDEHGFLWRQNTYWSYEERDGGLYIEVESVSLTRSVPHGLGWAIGPYIESIPRDSLEFTLRCVCDALRRENPIPTPHPNQGD